MNCIDYDKFLNGHNYTTGNNFYRSAVKAFKRTQINSENIVLPQNFSDARQYFNNKNISKTSLYGLRNALKELFIWINEEYNIDTSNAIEELQKVTYKTLQQDCNGQWFFKDLNDILSFINEFARDKGIKDDDLLQCKSLFCLYYYGYNNSEIINIKKSDVLTLPNISDEFRNILVSFSKIRFYRSFSKGNVIELQDSDYLFRSKLKQHLSAEDLRVIVSSFNKAISKYNKSLRPNTIYKIALFNKMLHDDNCVNTVLIKEYNQWLMWMALE